MLGEREAVGDLKSVVDYQAQQDALNHLTALALFLVVLDNLQHHLWKGRKKKSNISAAVEKEAEREVDDSLPCFQWHLLKIDFIFWIANILSILSFIAFMQFLAIVWFMVPNTVASLLVMLIWAH